VVFLGGHLCTPVLWEAQCRALSDVADCLPLELAGGDTMRALARAALARAPDRLSLVGLSMGGHVAMEIMRQAPERVERLALVDTRAGVDSPERLRARERDARRVATEGFDALAAELPSRWMSASNAARPGLRDRVLAMVRSVREDTREDQIRALRSRIDSRPFLPAIACPTLVLCGRQDAPNPVWMHEEMAALIPGATLKIVEDCGHLSPVEQPDAVSSALRNWLGHDTPGTPEPSRYVR
jgi:pimeloyl-ACP methyl ester carboxylesterase